MDIWRHLVELCESYLTPEIGAALASASGFACFLDKDGLECCEVDIDPSRTADTPRCKGSTSISEQP
jgi:hypothetical protein